MLAFMRQVSTLKSSPTGSVGADGCFGAGGGLNNARLLAVVHALHAHEHHHDAWQRKEQRCELGDGEPMLAQRQGGTGHNCAATENQATPATKPAA
jgi:hypothetical protein